MKNFKAYLAIFMVATGVLAHSPLLCIVGSMLAVSFVYFGE